MRKTNRRSFLKQTALASPLLLMGDLALGAETRDVANDKGSAVSTFDGVLKTTKGWRLKTKNMVLDIDRETGSLSGLTITVGKEFAWSAHAGDVTVRDDLLRKTFDRRDLAKVRFDVNAGALVIEKSFRGAPWLLKETYRPEDDVIGWDSEVILDAGDFRSCAVTYNIPWPQPLYPVSFWAARKDMPSAPHQFAEIALEYGEVTSGILIPALCSYLESKDAGLMVAMPFDFRTPRFRFISVYREPDLQVQFDWMALSPARSARTSLLMRGTRGNWRSGLGWVYERFKEYFEPRSTLIDTLWGGHVSGGFNVSRDDVAAMATLGLKWHEIHGHFPAYGNYHSEGLQSWRSGHSRNDETLITQDMIKRTIENLHAVGAAAMPYIQVAGDGDDKLLPVDFEGSSIRDVFGNTVCAWPGTHIMNSDPALPFGKDITRQIKGMVSRYPEIDGVFLDQACYNFLDTAHDDGMTAIKNRPAYMTGLNYYPHLELLSSLLHPSKAIIANGPFSISIMKYVDGYMAEGSGWLCDHLQYYGISKPMFFLVYESDDRNIELMFRRCLIYGAGFTSYASATGSKDLYDLYLPLLRRMFGRRWVFDANPIQLPTGYAGGLYRKSDGLFVASVVSNMPRYSQRSSQPSTVCLSAAGLEDVQHVRLHVLGSEMQNVSFHREGSAVQVDVPGGAQACVIELEANNSGEGGQ